MDGQDDAMKSAMELFAARLAKRDVERPITDHRTVERLIAMLEPHEQQVVRLRIGLGPSPALTLAATAKIVGVSPSRIGQIEDKAFRRIRRSEEHTSELQSLMRISYAVFCLKKKKKKHKQDINNDKQNKQKK